MSDDLLKAARATYAPPYVGSDKLQPLTHVLADQIEAQAAEITRLRAALATARREGMEEAAKIADMEPELVGAMPAEFEKFSRETLARAASIATMRAMAAAIRAAAKEGKP